MAFHAFLARAAGCLGASLLTMPAQADVFLFGTPSQNIVCSVGYEPGFSDIRCMIYEFSGPDPAPAPAGCMAYWGHTFQMANTGPVEMICSDEHLARYDAGQVLPYGQTEDMRGITCTSRESGLTCQNQSGHGFHLSRRDRRVW